MKNMNSPRQKDRASTSAMSVRDTAVTFSRNEDLKMSLKVMVFSPVPYYLMFIEIYLYTLHAAYLENAVGVRLFNAAARRITVGR